MAKILVNQIECLKCGDKPFLANRHDFKYCKCGAVAVEGGMSYLKISGEAGIYKEMSISVPDEAFEAAVEALKWCDETGRNNLGRICAIARYMRDAGFEVRWEK